MAVRKQYRGVVLKHNKIQDVKPVPGKSGLFTRDLIRLESHTVMYRFDVDHPDNVWRIWVDMKWLIDQILDDGPYSRGYMWAHGIKTTDT
jgi:hypothetical protein